MLYSTEKKLIKSGIVNRSATGMLRAIARRAEVASEHRSKLIPVEREFQASQRLANAGKVLAEPEPA